MSASAAIELADVTKSFARSRLSRTRASRVLDGIDLHVAAGARFGIVGESGSGKTTLVRMIAGLERPSAGSIRLFGRDVTGLSGRRRRAAHAGVQMIFQDPAGSLDPRMTVFDIVAEPLPRTGDRNGAVRRAIESVELDAAALRRYPHQFSGGQRQRISIARALVARPRILIADEAVSALDVGVQAQILDLIDGAVAESAITLVFVSHDLSVVRRICDDIAVVHHGRIVEHGNVDEVYAHPADPYTRDLLRAVPTLDRALDAAKIRAGQPGDAAGRPAG